MTSQSDAKFFGGCAILAGVGGFLYAVSFIVLRDPLLYSLCLTLIGLFSSAALTGVYSRVRDTNGVVALWALLLGIAGALGSAAHGAYDLANAINVPASIPSNIENLPSQIDPRGFLTFGVSGVALFLFAWFIARSGEFPKTLAYLGYLSAALSIVLYVGRLIILSTTNPIILVPALLNGFIVNPLWFIWLGVLLTRGKAKA